MKTIRILSFAALLSTFAATHGRATDLAVGGGPTNVTSGYTPSGFTALVVGEGGEFDPALNVTVNIAWAVISNDTANPLHGLTFEYQVSTIGTNVSQLELSGYTGPVSVVNVASTTASSLGLSESYFTAGGTAPTSADWLGQLDFNWNSSPGVRNTDVVIVDTAATGWREGDGTIDNGAFSALIVIPIPEPESIRLAALGTAALLWLGHRKRFRRC